MKKICILLSLMIMLFCSGCVPEMKPILEGTYVSYDEENNTTFSKSKFTIKEITKEEYEDANGINVFIDGSTHQRQEKIYLSIEFYLYSVETEEYENVTLSNLSYTMGTKHCYNGEAYLKINDKVYKDDYASFAFYYFGDDNAGVVIFLGELATTTDVTFKSSYKLQ